MQGHNVLRINHLGDWGTQFGMLITHLQDLEESKISEDGFSVEKERRLFAQDHTSLMDLNSFYKAAKIRFNEDTMFKKKAQLATVALQQGNKKCQDVWQFLCDVSLQEFNKIYERLNITLEPFGESHYNSMVPDLIEELQEKNLVKINDGALIMYVIPNYPPLMIQKSDKGFGYDTTDLCCLKYRLQKLNCDQIIYLTDHGQKDHFELLFAAVQKLGWNKSGTKLYHMSFGLVLGLDGKKLCSRSGDAVRLVELLDEAKLRAALLLRKKEEE